MKTIVYVLCFLLISNTCVSQLQADFSTSDGKTGGCSPYVVSFKNLTKGASAAAIYKWDLGDNNYSKNFEPGSTYIDERTYTITLTVIDSGNVSSKSLQITVYKKPSASFSVDVTKACVPFTTVFKSTSVANDGEIRNRFWDFGDGYTKSVNSDDTISHTYFIAQNINPRLVVTNSYGCQNSIQKTNIIQAYDALNSNFTADKLIVCKLADTVHFSVSNPNNSAISYLWDFGDGVTSTQQNPAHRFAVKGIYDVKLAVGINAGLGCKSNTEKAAFINVNNFHTDFAASANICNNTTAVFLNTSSPTPNASLWSASDDNFQTTVSSLNNSKSFTKTGDIIIRLINSFGECKDTVDKKVSILPLPVLNGFLVSNNLICAAPYTTTFQDTCKTATKWNWIFDANDPTAISNVQSPTFTFTNNADYKVSLSVTDAAGCSNSTSKIISIQKPAIAINIVSSSSIFQSKGCSGLTIKFGIANAAIITSYAWNFDDGTTSTLPQPTHIFNDIREYAVTLNYVTTQGCSGTIAYANKIAVNQKPKAAFTVSANTVCGNNKIIFTDHSSPKADFWYWDFGDNSYSALASNNNIVTHQYTDSGSFNITLRAYNGGCGDTIQKSKAVHILPPFNKIVSAANSCSENRNSVSFKQSSKYVNQVTWSFGDGKTLVNNSDQTQVMHDYDQSGTYKVYLKSYYNECVATDSLNVFVLIKQNPILAIDQTEICGNDSLQVGITNLIVNSYQAKNGYSILKWQYGDGADFTGTVYGATDNWTNAYQAGLTYFKGGKTDIRAIIKSAYFGCTDTTAYVPLKINGPAADFTINNNNSCYKTLFTFLDTSSANNSIQIQSRVWNFGDDANWTSSQTNSIDHLYAAPGNYNATLKVIDDKGCFAISTIKTTAAVLGVKSKFEYSPSTAINPGIPVKFMNTSVAANPASVRYSWTFNNSHYLDSSASSIILKYKNISADTVTLIASDTVNKCADTAVGFITINKMYVPFKYAANYIDNNNCPPLVLYATSKPMNADSVRWDFGDGSIAGNILNPSHTYGKPGVYIIKQYGFINNIIDSTSDIITIKGPYAILKASAYQKCAPANLVLTANIINAVSYAWDFNDGTLHLSEDTLVSHTYLKPGIYNPSLVLKDSAGCISASNLPTTILMDSLSVAMSVSAKSVCDATSIDFSAASYSLGSDLLQSKIKYKWFFGDTENTVSSEQSPSFKYNKPGNYRVILLAQSDAGCTVQSSDSVFVNPLPIINAGTDKYIVHGSSDVMNAMTSDSCLSFEWTPALYLSEATILNPIVTPLQNQQYLLKATSKSGCSSIDTVKVTVLTQIDVPNIFSPNGDGINDTWQIKFLDSYPGATVDVFNRYGQKIYHSNGYSREWDGTLNGVALPIGTYYYVIDPKNKKAVMSGSLTIMR